MDLTFIQIMQYVYEIAIFLLLSVIFGFIYNKLKNNPNRILKADEYFPEDELHSLRQGYFLIMMALCFVNILYSFIVYGYTNIFFLAIFDIGLSIYLAIILDKRSWKGIILLFLLVPYGSIAFFLNNDIMGVMELFHIPVFIYFIKAYYDKFRKYTESNGLGIAVLLLFLLIFISFFITQFDEAVNPLDALVMVSNAFTSNGYAVLGSSLPGKINAIILVWGGYILSGVGTATLTTAILMRHFNRKFEELEELIKENNKK